MKLRSIAKVVVLAVLTLPVVLDARQTFKGPELPKVDFKAQVTPKLTITTESGQSLPNRLKFESEHRGLDARAQIVKITYTKVGLAVEMFGGAFSSRTGMFATSEHPFQELLLEFGSNGELVTEKLVR